VYLCGCNGIEYKCITIFPLTQFSFIFITINFKIILTKQTLYYYYYVGSAIKISTNSTVLLKALIEINDSNSNITISRKSLTRVYKILF